MKVNYTYIILITVLLFGYLTLSAQPTNINKLNADSLRTGKWITPLDKDLRPAQDTLHFPFYRVVNYVSGKPVGFVNYYYKSGRLYFQTIVTSIGPDKYADGKIKFFSEKGDVIRELNYFGGMLNGEAAYFYPDGKQMMQGYYTDNIKTGFWKQFKPNGDYGIGEYENDLPDGPWTFYYADGSLQSEGKFYKGVQQGKWKEYKSTGETAEGNYLDGMPDGLWTCKSSDGKPLYEGSYTSGKRNGIWKEWSPDGSLSRGNYTDDIRNGFWTFFDPSGSKQLEGNFLNGNQDGSWQRFDNLGNIIETKNYKDGEVIPK